METSVRKHLFYLFIRNQPHESLVVNVVLLVFRSLSMDLSARTSGPPFFDKKPHPMSPGFVDMPITTRTQSID